ncbi:MAG: hypothetical protein Q9167_000949 [Letrouitia subvulpina]
MRPLYLAFTLLAAPLTLADWSIDLYPTQCPTNDEPGEQVIKDTDIHACDAAPKALNDNKGTKAIKVTGITGTGLWVHLYSGAYCPLVSHFASVSEDGCYNSVELVPGRTVFDIKVDRDRTPKDNDTETASP